VFWLLKRLEARASAEQPVLYCDEVDIHLNPKPGATGCFAGIKAAS